MQNKLTLRLDDRLIAEAKAYSRRRGKSISQMVADYFKTLASPAAEKDSELTPIVRSLKGRLRGSAAGAQDIRKHWEAKYL